MIGDNIRSWHDSQPIQRTRAEVFPEWLFVTVGVLDFALVIYNFGIGAAFKWLFICALVWAWLVTWAGLVNKGAKQTHQDVATGIVLIAAGLLLRIVLVGAVFFFVGCGVWLALCMIADALNTSASTKATDA